VEGDAQWHPLADLEVEVQELMSTHWVDRRISLLRRKFEWASDDHLDDSMQAGFAAAAQKVRSGQPIRDLRAFVYKAACFQLTKTHTYYARFAVADEDRVERALALADLARATDEVVRPQALIDLREIAEGWPDGSKRSLFRLMINAAVAGEFYENPELAGLMRQAGYTNATRNHVATWKCRIRDTLEADLRARDIDIADVGLLDEWDDGEEDTGNYEETDEVERE
jgi:hypothetical protein